MADIIKLIRFLFLYASFYAPVGSKSDLVANSMCIYTDTGPLDLIPLH